MTFYRGRFGLAALLGVGIFGFGSVLLRPPLLPSAQAQAGGAITLESDVQEANTVTGVITARGNVQIDYPAEQIYATSAQAEYYSNERRIVLSGNVVIDQEGSTLEAEVVTYLIDEGQFVAVPNPEEQVRAVYLLPEAEPESVQDSAAPGRPAAPSPPVLLEVSPIEGSNGGSDNTAPSAPLEN
ncbi:MAG: LptA/OstA family protein [Nodosilinea sp.]